MRRVILGIVTAFSLSPAQAAEPDCFPVDEVFQTMKLGNFALTFQGRLDGVPNAAVFLIFTEAGGEWFALAITRDGFGCPIAAGGDYNLTIGSLM